MPRGARVSSVDEETRRSLVAEFEVSGLSQAEFSTQHGLSSSTFHRWVHRYGSGAPEKAVTLRKARQPRRQAAPTAFSEVVVHESGPPPATCVTARFPGGVELVVPAALVERACLRLLGRSSRC